ncbi:MAG: alpha/beta hydrolase [Candidatus Spechtbacterales bacterium]|nr:alpha/beta hydrolase [Candidatus Spechtbacterales bacterium]
MARTFKKEVVLPDYEFTDKRITIETLRHSFDVAYSECIIGEPAAEETILACHGFTSSRMPLVKTVLKEMAENAVNNQENLRIIAFDWPGHGESSKAVKYSFALLRGYLFRFMEALEIDRAHIFGMSMGGIAAIMFSAVYPEKVLTLTVQGAPLHAGDIKIATKVAGAVIISPALMFRRFIPQSFEFISHELMKKSVISFARLPSRTRKFKDLKEIIDHPSVCDIGISDLRRFSPQAFCDLVWEFLTLDITNELNLVRKHYIPVLILDGDSSEYVFVDTLPRLKRILHGPNTHAFHVAGVGHLASVLRPKETADRFDHFLLRTRDTWWKPHLS